MTLTLAPPKRAPAQHCDPASLCAAIQHDYRVFEKPRENRVRMVRQLVGAHWSEEGADKIVPLPLIAQYVDIIGRTLVPKEPRFMLATDDRPLKPAVKIMQTWVNRQIEKMCLASNEQRVVLDAAFTIGIDKVALATPGDAATYGWNIPAGQPCVMRVDFDDFVCDTHARDFSEVDYIGHRYRMSLGVAKELKHFSKQRKDLQADYDQQYNPTGDERVSMLGRTSIGGVNTDEYDPKVTLWEIYLPKKRLIVTLQSANGGFPEECADGDPLHEMEWIGPDHGPYHILGFGMVPGNLMPRAPVQGLLDLHEFINRSWRKLMRQGDRQKSVLPVRGASDADITRLNETDDGKAFRCDGEPPKEVDYGGPSPKNMATVMELAKKFNEFAGNLALLSGAAAQSPTATQDEMLNKNSTAGVVDKQEFTTRHLASVGKALCWFWWHDPNTVMEVPYNPPGVPEVGITRELHPYNPSDPAHQDRLAMRKMMRDRPWGSFDIRVDPYSLHHQTPQERLAYLRGLIGQVQPLMPLLQQQGIMLDVNFWLSKEAEYSDTPDVVELFKIQEPPVEQEPGSAPEQPGMAQETTRNYVRESRSQKTAPGQDTALQQALMTGKGAGGYGGEE